MSLRDEIARALFARRWPDYDFDEHLRMYEAGQAVHPKVYNDTTIGNAYADRDALMPLVESAVKEGINLHKKSGLQCGAEDCEACAPAIDAIVARVLT